jgi:hypothetical protein
MIGMNNPLTKSSLLESFSLVGITPWIAERILNHVSARQPLEEPHDTYDSVDEKRHALEAWDAYLYAISQCVRCTACTV